MLSYQAEFIEFMVKSGVLIFGDFLTKSGRRSPYFVNTGNYRTGAQADKLSHYYAQAVQDIIGDKFDVLFGPAYKGIPLCCLTAAALYREFGYDKGYCFNRKEAKDHGEGGLMVGWQLHDGDRVVIIEDVITAGTALRETLPILKSQARVDVAHMFISVNRMERGLEGITAIDEVNRDFGIQVHPIVTVLDVLAHLHNREVDGRVYIDDVLKRRMEEYIGEYCVL